MMFQISHKYKFTLLLFFVLLIAGCKSTTEYENRDPKLEFISEYSLDIDQPSGIAYNKDFSAFWIIDGNSERIFKTDLKGNKLERLLFKGEDIEAICFDGDNALWITEEESREIVQLDLAGNVLARYSTGIVGSSNNGLEGIALDQNKNIFVLNEKKPKRIYALNKNHQAETEFEADYALDLSDMSYHSATKNFFILSDESRAVFVWNIEKGMQAKYDLPVTKAEGITINPLENKLAVVNDSLKTLTIYQLKP